MGEKKEEEFYRERVCDSVQSATEWVWVHVVGDVEVYVRSVLDAFGEDDSREVR